MKVEINDLQMTHKTYSKHVRRLESWPGQFLMKSAELDVVSNFFKFKKDYIGLEIGCGVGFQSSMIAKMCRKIVAMDIYYVNRFTHSLGIDRAKEYLSGVNVGNVDLVSCSAERLPFKDNYFDFVFSSSVLEHITNRELALKEINRVLKKNGYAVAVVPNFMLSVYAFFYTPLYLIKRAVVYTLNSIQTRSNAKACDSFRGFSIKNFRESRPSFPLPEPHGSYKSIFHEMFEYFPFRWHSLFRKSGLRILVSRTTCFLPWSLMEVFSTKLGANLYSAAKWAHMKLSVPVSISYLFCIVARKD